MSQKVHSKEFPRSFVQVLVCFTWNTCQGKELPRGSFQQGNGCFCVPILLKQSSNSISMHGQCLWSVPTQAMRFFFWQRSGSSSSWLPIGSIALGPYYRRHTHLPLLLAICPPFCGFLSLLVQRHHGCLGLYFWSLQVVNTVPVPSGLRTRVSRELSGNKGSARMEADACSLHMHNKPLLSCWGSSCNTAPYPHQTLASFFF